MHEKLNGGTNGLLRGEKGETWEGGMRVPTIFHWPGKIPAGKVSTLLGSQLDLLATFADLAGVQLPSNKSLDSHSLLPVLLNDITTSPRKTVFYYRATTLMAVRYHDYKAHFVTRSGWDLEPPEKHDPPLLYHLGQDPSEQYPLDPDQYKDIIASITKIAEDHTHSIQPLPKSQLDEISITGEGVIPCCQLHNCTCNSGLSYMWRNHDHTHYSTN